MTGDTEEQSGGLLHCPHCRESIPSDYLDQFPFPEAPCPCCGSLVQRPSVQGDDDPPDNRRQDERFSVALKVTYPNLKRFMVDFTKNVSRGGMFIRTKSPYDPGQQIDLSLHVPGLEGPVRIVARVVHNKLATEGDEDSGIGVEFIEIDEKSREMLIAAVRQQAIKG